MSRRKTTEEFIKDAINIHGNRYNYSVSDYKGNRVKITIKCYVHGFFEQLPYNHLKRQGCPECGRKELFNNRSNNRLNKKFKGIKQPEDYKLIPLTKGKLAKVDNEDFYILSSISWRVTPQLYANSTSGLMHRFILNCPKNMEVDHINHDTLDNRRSNLRICSPSENQMNKSIRKNKTSKYKGVSLYKNKWRAQIRFRHKNINLGLFDNEIDAAKAYDKMAIELTEEFAFTNFK